MISTHDTRILARAILGIIGGEALLVAALLLHSATASQDTARLEQEQRLVQSLKLSDLCLVTESRHTRHISLPEPVAPFQDLPGYHDHFPSSTFLRPPAYFGRTTP